MMTVVVIGGSAGSTKPFEHILDALSADFALPILFVQHRQANDVERRYQYPSTRLQVIEPCDKTKIVSGSVYIAPANYHMLLEQGGTIALSIDPKVKWSRPSIDVLFESAAFAQGKQIIAVLLSGANNDGTRGLRDIRQAGGLTIAQDPATADSPTMPQSAIDAGVVNEVLDADRIAKRLIELAEFTHFDKQKQRRRNGR